MSEALAVRLRSVWNRLWFEPGRPENLAAARIIVAAHALWVLWSWDIAALSGLPSEFFDHVATSTRWRFLIFPGHPLAESWVEGLAAVALIAVLLGVWTRVAALLAALLLYHLGPLQTFLVQTDPHNRGFTLAILSLVVLSAARSADVWRLSPRRSSRPPAASWEYTWPLRLMQLFVAQVYLFGLYGQLARHGWRWFAPSQLGRHAVLFEHVHAGNRLTGLGSMISNSFVLSSLAVVLVLVLEAGFVATLFSRTARRFLVPFAAAWHLGVLLATQMFYVGTFHLLLFVNWSWVTATLGGRPASGAVDPQPVKGVP